MKQTRSNPIANAMALATSEKGGDPVTRFSADNPTSIQAVPEDERRLFDYCKHCPTPNRLDLYSPLRVDILSALPGRGIDQLKATYRCDDGHCWTRGYAASSEPASMTLPTRSEMASSPVAHDVGLPLNWDDSPYIAGQVPQCDDEAFDAMLNAVRQWRTGGKINVHDRIYATQGLGLIAAALAEVADGESAKSSSNIAEAVIGFTDAFKAMSQVATKYAAECRSRLDLVRKPVSRGARGTNLPTALPPGLASQERTSTDEEARIFAEENAAVFDQIAELSSQASVLADIAFGVCSRFCDPSAPWLPRILPTPTALYFWFDADGVLLYIGITGDLATRQSSHAKRSSWAEFADHSQIHRFPSRPEAEAAEKAAIEAERPLFNHVHNDTAEARQRLVAYLIEHGRMDLLAPAVSRG